jgi:hypothetical protein
MQYITYKSFSGYCPFFKEKQTIKAKYKLINDKYFSLLFTECEYENHCNVPGCPVKELAKEKINL